MKEYNKYKALYSKLFLICLGKIMDIPIQPGEFPTYFVHHYNYWL